MQPLPRRPRRAFVAAMAAAVAAWCGAAAAQPGWPTKPVKMIVPFPPGAAPDVVARLLAERLSRAWGQTVFVENKPGAGGIPGMVALAHSAPDGQTIALVPAAAATLTPYLYKNPQYSIDKDVVPVAAVATSPMMIVANANSGIKSLADLQREAKANAGKVNFAAAQPNSLPHLTGEMLSKTMGLGLFTVPYAGSQAAVTAVLSGDAQITIDGLPGLVQHVKAGKLRALAVTSDQRLPGFQDVPTVAETVKGFDSVGWFAVFVPAGTPATVTEPLNASVNKALQEPDLVARFAEMGIYPKPGTQAAMKAFLAQQQAQSRRLIDEMGLQPQ